MSIKSKLAGGAIVVVAAFLAGFLPQYLESSRLRTELDVAQRQTAIDKTRVMAGRILLEASRQNYGSAQDASARYFNALRELAEKPENTEMKTSLLELLNARDSITSSLAQGDPAVVMELQTLMQRTYDLPDARAR
ncbi:MAG TPA: hypothetical protein VFY29_10000 [Terriglobia bacterium]|nr:hypothetical protein [Terriglobia bacterium]